MVNNEKKVFLIEHTYKTQEENHDRTANNKPGINIEIANLPSAAPVSVIRTKKNTISIREIMTS